MQLSSFNMNVARQHVVKHYVLDEIVSVVFFVIILLYAGKSNGKYACILCCHLVCSLNENSIVRFHMSTEWLIGITVSNKNVV